MVESEKCSISYSFRPDMHGLLAFIDREARVAALFQNTRGRRQKNPPFPPPPTFKRSFILSVALMPYRCFFSSAPPLEGAAPIVHKKKKSIPWCVLDPAQRNEHARNVARQAP